MKLKATCMLTNKKTTLEINEHTVFFKDYEGCKGFLIQGKNTIFFINYETLNKKGITKDYLWHKDARDNWHYADCSIKETGEIVLSGATSIKKLPSDEYGDVGNSGWYYQLLHGEE